MSKDNLLFATFGLALGLIIGSLVIGPKIAQSKLATAATVAHAGPAAPAAGGNGGGDPMAVVMQQLAALKARVASNPNDFEALVQLGNLYMDAVKYPQAIDYYERALRVRNDERVRADLGIAVFNNIVRLGGESRFDEARAMMPRLKELRPNDAEVARLEQALNQPMK